MRANQSTEPLVRNGVKTFSVRCFFFIVVVVFFNAPVYIRFITMALIFFNDKPLPQPPIDSIEIHNWINNYNFVSFLYYISIIC